MTSDISDAKLDRCCPFKMQCTTHIMLGPSHRPLDRTKWNSRYGGVGCRTKRCDLLIRVAAYIPPVYHMGRSKIHSAMFSIEWMIAPYKPLFLIPFLERMYGSKIHIHYCMLFIYRMRVGSKSTCWKFWCIWWAGPSFGQLIMWIR